MTIDSTIFFTWEGKTYEAVVEREYENSVLVQVNEPSSEMLEKFTNRMIISKKKCQQTIE
ncbi:MULTISPECIES: hypothetical protein [unclassified Enterococcus]|jgi:hypothetical protein|uniref:hypothetical protein n=1 Tax=unclassified Enterococcus TaxID=2608891 RepID=UPI0006B9AB93|nr:MULTISPECIES: hypothetical protein [unclassified Enterococcus]KPG69598.1 hypothetical protein AEQ18_12935 [Enterococcus sp. RIT-PI-f]HCE13490.1 DUF2187 domain-containing protein [Enterococcus sp.]